MDLAAIKALEQQYVAQTYTRGDLAVLAGAGSLCIDDAGGRHIDFSSGIGVNSVGYHNPVWVRAVKEQLDRLAHMSNLFYTEPMAVLAKKLCKRTGMQRVFFSNSGAEANEGAIKTARKYGTSKYGPERCEIVTLENSFHGRTIATLAATGQEMFHRDFGPFPAGFVYARANDLADLAAKISGSTCAVLIECVQGEGGVVPLTGEFVAGVAALCAERDILLMVDEVQTGVGRTGKFLCCEHYGIRPDVVTLAKGLGGGLPIGAVLFGEKTRDTLGRGGHASTFGGNPVACAGAGAVLDLMDDAFLAEVERKGRRLADGLRAMPQIKSVSGRGMMLGAELADGLQAADVVAAAAKKGLILLTAKQKIRLLPPLTIEDEAIERGLGILGETLATLAKETTA